MQLSKPERRLLYLARELTAKGRGIERKPNDPHAFDTLLELKLITPEGKVTRWGQMWKPPQDK